MRDLSRQLWPTSGVGIMRQRHEAGPVVLRPVPDHRIIVHISKATLSTCRTTGTRHLRQSDDIDLVPAGETGGYDAAAPCENLEIRLAPGMLGRVALEMGHDDERTGLDARHILKNERIIHLARALESDLQSGAPSDPLYAEAIAIALATQLVGLSKRLPNSKGGLSARQLRRLFDFIEAHIDQSLTIATLAREAGASSSHLRHWFKEATSTTVHQYVMRRRVERARLLLLQGEFSASEAALASGFSHQSHLARWMRRELGYTARGLK